MKRPLLVVLAVAVLGVPSLAQAPPPATSTPAPAQEGEGPKLGLEEFAETPSGYTYNPQGRRDPFVSLLRPVSADRGPKTRKPGMEGFLIQEIALRGIVRTGGGGTGVAARPGFIAIFVGPTGSSYFVITGQRLFDGIITAVDATTVTFLQEVTDPLSPVKTRDLKKSLYATEEARQ